MDIIKEYGKYIKKNVEENPKKALNLIKLGLKAETLRIAAASDKRMPKAYKKLNGIVVNETFDALKNPGSCAWVNIFTPVEILQCFNLNCISIECFSSFLSGFKIEDYFIDYAESRGIAPTLCSYHKNFIGAVDAGVLPEPAFAVTTSMICDGNINTFRYLADRHKIGTYFLDIPNEYSKEAVQYVVRQLEEMIGILEKKQGCKFDIDKLKKILQRENETKAYYKEFLEYQKTKFYPNSLTMNLYMLYATHLGIGSKKIYDFFELLKEDIKTYPDFNGKSVFWVHLLPYYQETIKSYMNFSDKYFIKLNDFGIDYMEELDIEHPLEALAVKMICNLYNGPYEKKVRKISEQVKEMDIDAVINFCHWGCKQSSGGAILLKEEMNKMNIPMLTLDGDALDRRNSHDGQIKTRLEAFLELLDRG